MQYLFIVFFFLSLNSFAEEYVLNLTGEKTYKAEHNYSKKNNYRIFELEGAFTDNLGNYGNWNTIVYAEIENNLLKHHSFSLKYSYQDGSVVYAKGSRANEELEQGIGNASYISTPKKLASLIGTDCKYGVKFLADTAFVMFKCNISSDAKNQLIEINEK